MTLERRRDGDPFVGVHAGMTADQGRWTAGGTLTHQLVANLLSTGRPAVISLCSLLDRLKIYASMSLAR